jgi:hypothetical protein
MQLYVLATGFLAGPFPLSCHPRLDRDPVKVIPYALVMLNLIQEFILSQTTSHCLNSGTPAFGQLPHILSCANKKEAKKSPAESEHY